MNTVHTIAGPVSADRLGITYMHEHIFVVSPELQHYWPGYQGWDVDESIMRARVILRTLHEKYGVDTIVDPTVPGLGRNIRAIAAAAEGTGLNVVAATGWYIFGELPLRFAFLGMEAKATELEALFVSDFENGMEGTTIRPGVIKCYTDRMGVTPDVEAVLRASARTHLRTGLPIVTHSSAVHKSGLLQQAIFRDEGVDLGAVIIGHCNESDDMGYLEDLLQAGSILGFDKCGTDSAEVPLDAQLDNLAELCRRGYSERVVLSHDRMVYQDLIPSEVLNQQWEGGIGDPFGYISNFALPGLRARGVSEEHLANMLVSAPRDLFSRAIR